MTPRTRAGRLLLGKNSGSDRDPAWVEWLLNDILAIEQEAALAATDEPGLDVDRLARAMDVVVPESIPPLYWTNERLARAIAAEYARLTGQEGTPE